MSQRVIVHLGAVGRWIIVPACDGSLAWSGTRWVRHDRGCGQSVQVCNFDTANDAVEYAAQFWNAVEVIDEPAPN
jgi:hypothetical protein